MLHMLHVGDPAAHRVTWIKTTADTSGEYIRFSPVIGPTAQGALPGKPASPPIHAHDKQVECFEVVRGTMAYLLDGIEGLVGPQDTVADPLCVPPGVPHTFWIGDNTTELEIIVNLSPALHGEKFFRTLAGFQADFESNVSILQALLTLAHGDVRPAEIPKNVWGAVAPVLEVVARHVLGFQPFYAEYTRLQ